MATHDSAAPSRPPLRIGWLSTGRGPGSRALLEAAQTAISQGQLNATIDFVLCTRGRGEAEGSDVFLSQAEGYGLTTLSLSLREYRQRGSDEPVWRERYNTDLLAIIQSRSVDLLVFAGLMLIVSEDIIKAVPCINLHPAAPDGPTGTWQDVIWELIKERMMVSGVTVHLAGAEVDRGPVIAYVLFELWGGLEYQGLWGKAPHDDLNEMRHTDGDAYPLLAKIRRHSLPYEPYALLAALCLIADGHITVNDGVVRNARGELLERGLNILDDATVEMLQPGLPRLQWS